MSEELSTIQKIKQDIDELILQLSLGKKEAADFLNEQKDHFKAVVEDTKDRVTENAGINDETTASLQQKLDELRLQLELGRLEGREVFEKQREKIRDAIASVESDLGPVKERSGELLEDITEAFHAGAESFKAKLDAFALNADLGSMVVEEEAKLKKDELAASLKESAAKLKPAVEEAGTQMRDVVLEAREALEGVRKNLSQLFKS